MRKLVIILSFIFALSCQEDKQTMPELSPPVAKLLPKTLEKHGDKREDPYYWLRDRESEEVLHYLREENTYFKAMTEHTEDFQENLFQEMRSRIKEDDQSVPYFKNGYWYITRYEEGKEYPVYTRKKDSLSAVEELLLDVNVMAEGHEYYQLQGISLSPDNQMLAFGVDTVSRRQYTLQIKDQQGGEILNDRIENTTGRAVWAADNKTLFYTKKDPVTLRSDKIYRHRLGTDASEDVLVYEETDDTFNTFVYKTKSEKYLVIGSVSTLTSEYRIVPADSPMEPFKIFSPRKRGVEYSIYHYQDDFYILTNADDALNFKLMKTPEGRTNEEHWESFIPHRSDVLLEDIEIFEKFLVLSERSNGLTQLRVLDWEGSEDYYLPFESETYVAYPYINPEFKSEKLRFVFNSMTSPYAIIDFDMVTKKQEIKKQQEVLGGNFKEENYRSERLWAQGEDGTKIPISLVYHKNTPLDGSSPLLQYGYGAYGHTSEPRFSSMRLSLLDRGFVFAIAHVRGGEYLGRPWYDSGKMLQKKNTFTDFIACSRHLIDKKYTSAEQLYAYGGSAGGLLMGAVVNMAPELYNGVIAAVPFVDVVTTMLDESIPLTTGEYDEWGNPNDEEYYQYIKSYSPYDNVKAQEYPNLLVTTGLHDSQVQYWEPAKWVAKLRATKTGDQKLFLETNMDTGHGGASGRFEALKETAREYAFLLDLAGKIP